jgi:hypothetical protein
MKRLILTLSVLALAVSEASANPPPPPPPPPPPGGALMMGAREAKLVVKKDDNAKDARLVIPASLLTANPKPRGFGAVLPTIMVGLALTAAFVSGGFWLVRRNRKVATVALVVSLVVFATAAVQADIAPGPRPGPPVPIAMPANVRHEGKLTLSIVPNGDTIELIVPSKMIIAEPKPNAPGNE